MCLYLCMQENTCIWEEGDTGTLKPSLQSNAGRTLMGCDEGCRSIVEEQWPWPEHQREENLSMGV